MPRMPIIASSLSSVLVASIGAVAAVAGAWMTAQAAVDSRVNAVDSKVQVVEERENNHYNEVKGSLDRIESKIDRALK